MFSDSGTEDESLATRWSEMEKPVALICRL